MDDKGCLYTIPLEDAGSFIHVFLRFRRVVSIIIKPPKANQCPLFLGGHVKRKGSIVFHCLYFCDSLWGQKL